MKDHYRVIRCNDGFSMSVQASSAHYCSPKNDKGPYISVEVGFPSEFEILLCPYQDGVIWDGEKINFEGMGKDIEDNANKIMQRVMFVESIFGYVPIEVIKEIIRKRGGLVNDTESRERTLVE